MSLKEHVSKLRKLRAAFRETFLNEQGKVSGKAEIVLLELRRFCYGSKPTIKATASGVDPYASIAAAARQEVYFRILSMIQIDDADIASMERLINLQSEGADG